MRQEIHPAGAVHGVDLIQRVAPVQDLERYARLHAGRHLDRPLPQVVGALEADQGLELGIRLHVKRRVLQVQPDPGEVL